MPNLSIRLFGYPRLLLDGIPVKMERRKTLALAAYLAVEGTLREISREQIATLLWPDCGQDQAGAYLRQALWDFARSAGDSWIAREEQTLLFKPDADLWVDARIFAARLAKWKIGEAPGAAAIPLLSELAGFYQGDFLAGFNLRDCPAYDEWQVYQAETFRLQLGQALEALVKAHTAGINHYQAVEYARRWLALDPLNEDAHLALMRLYANEGQRSAALQQYETLTRILADELGVEPGAETIALFEHIRDSVSMPDSAAAKPRPVSLPAQMTPFVGREEELARIAELLQDTDCRLISLVGIGGSGKTRLSIQAAGLSQGFPDGVYLVGLAVVNSYEQLLAAIAETLKVAFHNEPGSNLKLEDAKVQLMNHLAARQLLLVLDNFEQLSFCSNFLTELLDSSPGLKLIVTTRERLNQRGETVVEVGGLAFPENLEYARADHFSAVQLFVKSAARVGRFHPGDADWPAIVRVCELVEGIPLGLEMAAGWTRMLSCAEIATEIERNLDFLQTSWRGMPERQSTFRAIFEYSWRLLSAKDRNTFCRLSIFQGDFNRTAALEVASASLAALTSLIDKSMLRRLSSGRFEIHPVLRQYAGEKLAEEPDTRADTRQRYAAHYSNWLEEKYRQLKGSQQIEALTALRGETQNLYAAWRILVETHDVERLKAGLPAVILYNVMNDHRIEMQEFTGLLLDMITWLQNTQEAEGSPILRSLPSRTAINELHALTLAAYRHFTIDNSRPEPTIPYHKKSQELVQDIPENNSMAFVLLLNSIGPGILIRSAAIETAQQSYTIFSHLNDTWGSALAQMIYADGLTFGTKDYISARRDYQASLELFTQLGNDWGRALCLNGLSYVEYKTGHLREAFQLARQSLEMLDRLDNQERTTQARLALADIAEELGDFDSARLYHTLNRTRSVQRGEERLTRYFQERLDLVEKNQIGTQVRPPSER